MKHEKDICNLTAKEIKQVIKELKLFLYKNNIPKVSFKNKYGYVFYSREMNRKLFSLLDKSGFWDFHCTNRKKNICSLHQIVLYIHKGWKLFLYGYLCDSNETEIHHLDHDPSNNNISNLVYVTSQENKLLSDICRFTYNGYIKSESISPFGKRRDVSAFIQIIQKTVKATFERLGITSPTESAFAWLMSLPQKLGKEIVHCWQHLPLNTQLFVNSIFN